MIDVRAAARDLRRQADLLDIAASSGGTLHVGPDLLRRFARVARDSADHIEAVDAAVQAITVPRETNKGEG
ncbi:MAG TPA: hypothetical protein VNQ99_06205 [Xanthobacteraceae bacterium]|nr:hypothetical protein [Xanthobacteraceae bacterium]